MRSVVAVVLLSGCSSILGIDDFKVGDGGTTGNEMGDAGGYCLGPMGWQVCLAAAPTTPPVMISSSLMFDTVSSPLCAGQQPASWKAAGQPDACFIISTQVTFAAPTVQAIGARPLVVVASDSISVNTQLDVASHGSDSLASLRAPGSPSALCVAPTPAMDNMNAAGGGAGGSFMSKGGAGGTSSASAVGGSPAPADMQPPVVLRAGCDGGIGGNSGAKGGAAGAGGGAVYLVAGNRITINGFINASGSAGQGGAVTNAGGGGGGSGGMIHLHAPVIGGNGGVLVANGGGAGEGASGNLAGANGSDPTPLMPMMIPLGGNGQSVGGPGGNGFAGTAPATSGGAGSPTTAAAGGGGGGAGGYIRTNVAPAQVTSSPAVTIVP